MSESTSRPSLIEHVIAVTITCLMLEQHSRLPEVNLVVAGIGFLSTLGLVVAYGFHFEKSSQNQLKAITPKSLLHWLILPAAIIIMLTSAQTHWPASIRFSLSKSNFDNLIAQVERGEKPQGFPRRVGLYWIDYVKDSNYDSSTGQGTIGFITGIVMIDECGLIYDKTDPKSSHYLTTRIAPCWSITEW
ncbi:MAG TPA: hypothetical protein DD473_16280 [Planctomycetaceae bacterium]|nr:hypothetical protein [Planctomycetaceae bacterium]